MAFKGCLMAADVMDLGRGRGFSPQPIAEYRHDVRRRLGVDDHPLGRVLDPAGDIEQRRQPRHEGRKPTPCTRPRMRNRAASGTLSTVLTVYPPRADRGRMLHEFYHRSSMLALRICLLTVIKPSHAVR